MFKPLERVEPEDGVSKENLKRMTEGWMNRGLHLDGYFLILSFLTYRIFRFEFW